MRTLFFILQKEFRQIFRNTVILRMMFILPMMQLLILPQAADYEMKNIKISVIDHDQSSYSRQLITKISSSGYFILQNYTWSEAAALKDIETDRSDLILEIPNGFEKQLIREGENTLYMAVNAINGVKANLGGAYLRSIITDYNQEVRLKWIQPSRFNPQPVIEVRSSNWFNPRMNYDIFMVPGILVILLTLVGAFLSSLNIVKEKETGTIEQINVTPIQKHHFILGKLIPFWILGLVVLSIGLLISWVFYSIIPAGSFLLIYAFAALYLLAVLGLGLLLSTFTSTQQQAMLISFFMMMIFILMGGLYTPIDSMPLWAQYFTRLNPVTYFIEVMRMVIMKGSGFSDIRQHFLITAGFAVAFNGLAILSYRKRSG